MIQLLGDKDGTEEHINTTDLEMDITNPYYPENVLNLNLSRFEGLQKKRIISVGFENLQIQNVEKLELFRQRSPDKTSSCFSGTIQRGLDYDSTQL